MESDVLRTILVYALPVLFAITLHEAAHGYVARMFGDTTAAEAGRISANPLRHIDPIGTIAMPLLLYVATSGQFVFGYAKPVPVDFRRLRHPRRDMVWVAAAGPGANLVQAFAWALFGTSQLMLGTAEPFFLLMAKAGVLVNLVMFALNLFPVPPLDGGRILVGLLPRPLAAVVARIEPFGFFIVMGLVIAGLVATWWMLPVMRATLNVMRAVFPSLNAVLSAQA
ncbi:site-2 protease family protein [Caldimonas sp. KR1-144]|uniref:site-2 protease family protein n=1 Tax=Caldimonas sp. KR1-144 TaxID=3400911 RepID=UPI003C0B1DEB